MLASRSATAETPSSAVTGSSLPRRRDDSFVGRSGELAQVTSFFDDATAGNGRVVLITGEAGIGKTRLAVELAKTATSRGATVVWGRSWDEGAAPAYWPWTTVLREVAPALAEELRAPGATANTEARFTLFESVANGLRDAARTAPLVVILDDVHAADPSSLSLLLFMARETRCLRDARLLVIAIYREAEARRAESQRDLLARIGREAPTIEVPRLLDEDVRLLLQETASVPMPVLEPVVRLVLATAEGVPLFVHELARTLFAEGSAMASTAPLPDGVRGIIRAGLAAIDVDTRNALESASVVGQTFTVGLAAAASELPPAQIHEAMEAASHAEVLKRVAPGRYAFAHALVREVLYRDIAGGKRARIHARIASSLEKSGATDERSLLAHHALRAAPAIGAARAVRAAIDAAHSTEAVLAFEDARLLLTRALAVLDLAPPDPALHTLRAEVTRLLSLSRAETADDSLGVTKLEPTVASTHALELSCEGEVWTIRFGKTTVVRLKDSRGLHDLAQLVASAGKEISALTLVTSQPGDDPPLLDGGDAGEMLDREAVDAYRTRLADLEDDAREAEAWSDVGRAETIHAEMDALRSELSRAVGLGGRQRRASNTRERARVNVTRRLKDAIRRIGEQDKALGRHLEAAVRTGAYCSYQTP